MILPLQLRHRPGVEAAPDAWFLPGHSAGRWLDELARCGLANEATRLFVVPRSTSDRAPAGLLIVPDRATELEQAPAGVPCRRIAGRLFVPVDAELHPPVTDTEVRALCPLAVSFFHPASGLCAFEEESTRRAWDLIEFPDERAEDWNAARAGAPPLPALNAVLFAQPPSIEDVFGGAPEEIGSEPPLDLPPVPGEPRENPLGKIQRTLRRAFAKGVSRTLKRLPHTGSRRTWVNQVEDWANRQLRRVNEQLDKIRNKELLRLLHLFDSDPEEGLRHAIPMNSFAHRGLAPPGGRLVRRPPDFDLSRLGGGRADFWNVSLNLQEVLRRRYREMADREMQLGRHRRAAFIYAELLGDLVSAANALKQGRWFREAALLYEDHLKNPLEAARCLAEGGLFAEAIVRYEKLGRWLDIADLYERLGNRADAEIAVRRVMDERIAADDLQGAAKLADERLHSPDEALELLRRAWPSSRQAAGCVAAAFQILARLGRHDDALEQLAKFSLEPVPDWLALPLLNALAGPARDFPHELVRHRAADFSRVLIARRLGQPGLPLDDAGRLVECLARLAPQDRLLARDGNRHLAERRALDLRAQHVTPPPAVGSRPVVQHRFELPRQIQWLQLRREWHWFYALGITPKRLTVVRGVWEGVYQSLSWEFPAELLKHGFVFEPTAERGKALALATNSVTPLPQKKFPGGDVFFGQECLAGTPTWLPSRAFPFAIGEDALWSVHLASGQAVLSCYDKVRGQLLRTLDVTEDLLSGAQRTEGTRLCLTAFANGVAIALGNRLLLTRGDGGVARLELPGQATGLITTLPHTRQGIGVMLEHGAVLHWIGTANWIELDRDIASPLGAFVPAGPLVLVSGNNALLLEVDGSGVRSVTRMELPGQRVVGVSATASPGQFAVLGAAGEMTVFRMPR